MTGLVAWAGGGVLAVAVAWGLSASTARTGATPGTAVTILMPPAEVTRDTAETPQALLMPEDVLVGRRTPTTP